MSSGAGQRALQSLGYVPVLHPEFFALYPVLGLFAHNAGKLPPEFLIRPAMYMLLAAVALWILLSILLRGVHRGGLAASLLIFSALSGWGVWASAMDVALPHVRGVHPVVFFALYAALTVACVLLVIRYRPRTDGRASLRRFVTVFVVIALVIGGATWSLLGPVLPKGGDWMVAGYLCVVVAAFMLLLEYRGDHRRATRTLNWFGGVLLVLALASSLLHRHDSPTLTLPALDPGQAHAASPPAGTEYPDIYLLILEGYARADVLRTSYGYNNLPFLSAMRERGFNVANDSITNYPVAITSVASMLNLDYLHKLAGDAQDAQADMSSVVRTYTDNRAFALLRSKGYQIVAFSPGVDALEPCRPMADTVLKPPFAVSEFEQVLMRNCAAAPVLDGVYYWRYGVPGYWLNAFERHRMRYIFSTLPSAGGPSSAPKLVLAHAQIPDQPFLFTRNGGWARPTGVSLRGEPVRATWRQYSDGYVEQLHYLNRRLLEFADAIAANPKRPAVVLIVSSRGPSFEPAGTDPTQLHDRFPNLIMARFPEQPGMPQPALPAEISLVNVLRFTFDRVLGTSFGQLPNEAFMANEQYPLATKPTAGTRSGL